MLKIDDLLVSQECVEAKKVQEMTEFVRQGGIWTEDVLFRHDQTQVLTLHGAAAFPSPLIAITQFQDGTLLIHNGHHRIRATREIRDFLYDQEYIISYRPLEEYLEINFAKTFVTPYDPRISIRLFDFGDYKRHVMSLFKRDREMAIRYIQENSTQYRKERQIFRVMELKLVEVERNSL